MGFAKISNIFRVLDIPDIPFFQGGDEHSMLGPSVRMKKKKSPHPWELYMYLYSFCRFDFYLWPFYLIFCVLPFMF